jgi:HEAT repeat protein
MIGASSRRVLLVLCGLATMTVAGCADLDFLPSWVPFQGPASDEMAGVVSPRERIERLKKLSEAAAKTTPEERTRVSEQLAASIRTEKDPLIRLEIIRTLGRYPGSAADVILKAALSDSEVRIRTVACEAWGKRNDAQAVALLSEALRSDVDADVRIAAAAALGETKNPAAVAALGEALNDSDPAMQYRAVLALQQATGKKLGDNIERWQQYVKEERRGDPAPSTADREHRLF